MPVELENQILKIFYVHCPDYRDHTGAPFDIYAYGPNREDFHYRLSPEKLVETFEDAHSHAFSLIEEGIIQLKTLQTNCERIKIVIGGGSTQGAMWLARMTSLCSKHQMMESIYLWQIDQIYEYVYRTFQVCLGDSLNDIGMRGSQPEQTTPWPRQSLWHSSLTEPPSASL